MPRAPRIVIPRVAHRVTQRGNDRQDVFFVADDRRVYPYEIWGCFPNYRKGRTGDAGNMGSVPIFIHKGTSIESKTGVNRRPHVWVEDAQTRKAKKVYEAGRTNKDGTPVSRERAKKAQYDAAGIPHEFGRVT